MLNSIDWRDANQSVLVRQHLAPGAKDTDALQVVRDVAGLHATSAATPYLSLFNRVSGFEQADLEQALYKDRSLARVRCVRRTIYIHSTDLLPIVMAATAPMVVKASRRYMVARGVSLDEYGRLAEEIRQLLVGTEMAAPAIRAALGTTADVSAVLYLMCDDGILVRGRPEKGWRDQRHRYALFCEWFPNVDLVKMSAEAATIELVRRYVAAFGPVTEEDVAWWTGLGKTKIRKALEKLGGELAEVRVSGVEARLHSLRRDAMSIGAEGSSATPVVNLLPALDPYVMGYKERARYLDEEHRDWVFDRSGNATSTILIDGRVAGVWDFEEGPASGQPAVKLFSLRMLSDDEWGRVRSEAARVGQFVAGREVDIVECDSMVPLTKRTAGSMMSPLKRS